MFFQVLLRLRCGNGVFTVHFEKNLSIILVYSFFTWNVFFPRRGVYIIFKQRKINKIYEKQTPELSVNANFPIVIFKGLTKILECKII